MVLYTGLQYFPCICIFMKLYLGKGGKKTNPGLSESNLPKFLWQYFVGLARPAAAARGAETKSETDLHTHGHRVSNNLLDVYNV